jgi:toxin ParE1/3/4
MMCAVSRFLRTARAEEDLIEIWLFVAQHNPGAPDALLDRIDRVCESFTAYPALGPARPDLAADLRYINVGRYLILDRIIAGGVEIVRLVHGVRHLPD